MAKRIMNTTPRQDGFRMPGEFEKQAGMWMLWPERNDNWRDGAKPAITDWSAVVMEGTALFWVPPIPLLLLTDLSDLT